MSAPSPAVIVAESGDRASRIERDAIALIESETGVSGVAIRRLRRASAGVSSENWLMTVTVPGADDYDAVVRQQPDSGLLNSDREREADILDALADRGVPVPRVRWRDFSARYFDKPTIIMDFLPGECDYLVLNGKRPAEQRLALARRIADLLAEVHRLDWTGAPLETALVPPTNPPAIEAVEHWTAELRSRVNHRYPELEAAAYLLRQRAPDTTTVTVVHGDYKPGNILIDDDRLTGLLDWETAHLGDPLEDLGWVTLPVRAREHLIPGIWESDHYIGHYENARGVSVDREAVHWWRLLAAFKLAVIQLTAMTNYLEGRTDQLVREPAAYLTYLFAELEKWGGAAMMGEEQ